MGWRGGEGGWGNHNVGRIASQLVQANPFTETFDWKTCWIIDYSRMLVVISSTKCIKSVKKGAAKIWSFLSFNDDDDDGGEGGIKRRIDIHPQMIMMMESIRLDPSSSLFPLCLVERFKKTILKSAQQNRLSDLFSAQWSDSVHHGRWMELPIVLPN